MKKLSTDAEVSKEDQKNINNFSKLYSKQQELEESLVKNTEKKSQHQDTLDQIEMNDDDETLRYRFGSVFFYLPTTQVRELVEKEIQKVVEDEVLIKKQLEDNSKKLKRLKATLYSKFGNSINLEE